MRAREVVPDGFVLEDATLPAAIAAVAEVAATTAPVMVAEVPELDYTSHDRNLGGGDLEPEAPTIDVALEPLPPTEEEAPPAPPEAPVPSELGSPNLTPMSGELRPPGPPYILPPDEATYVARTCT